MLEGLERPPFGKVTSAEVNRKKRQRQQKVHISLLIVVCGLSMVIMLIGFFARHTSLFPKDAASYTTENLVGSMDVSNITATTPLNTTMMEKIIHIDMKGYAAKNTYLQQVFPFLSELGATGILLEWEHMLPFTGEFTGIRSNDAYSAMQVRSVLNAAKKANLEVIPLLPSIDKLEFLLKHAQFASLRGSPPDITSLCPSNPESIPTLQRLISQIIQFHPGIERVHIGSTFGAHFETSHYGKGKNYVSPYNVSLEATLWLDHTHKLVQYLAEEQIRTMMWDTPLSKLSEFGPGDDAHIWSIVRTWGVDVVVPNDLTDLGVSEYTTPNSFYEYLSSSNPLTDMGVLLAERREVRSPVLSIPTWETMLMMRPDALFLPTSYRDAYDADLTDVRRRWHVAMLESGTRMFGAGSYKDVNSDMDVVSMADRGENTFAWLRLAHSLEVTKQPLQLSGLVLMGDSRLSHYSPLTQSLPSALPSLALALNVLKHGYYDEQLLNDTARDLGLLHSAATTTTMATAAMSTSQDEGVGTFPGKKAYEFTLRLQETRLAHDAMKIDVSTADMSVDYATNYQAAVKSIHELYVEAPFILGDVMYGSAIDELLMRLSWSTAQQPEPIIIHREMDVNAAVDKYHCSFLSCVVCPSIIAFALTLL